MRSPTVRAGLRWWRDPFLWVSLGVTVIAVAVVAILMHRSAVTDRTVEIRSQAALVAEVLTDAVDAAGAVAVATAEIISFDVIATYATPPAVLARLRVPERVRSWSFHPQVQASHVEAFQTRMQQHEPSFEVFVFGSDGSRLPVTNDRAVFYPAAAVHHFTDPEIVARGMDIGIDPRVANQLEATLATRTVSVGLWDWEMFPAPLWILAAPIVDEAAGAIGVVLAMVDLTPTPTLAETAVGVEDSIDWTVVPASESIPTGSSTVQTAQLSIGDDPWHIAAVGAPVGFLHTAPTAAGLLLIGLVVSMIVHLWAERHRHRLALTFVRERLDEKDRFLANVAHSLRTPLTGILGFLEVLRSDYPSETDGRELLDLATTEAEALSLLTNDLLLAGRLDTETIAIRPEPVDLRTETERVVAGYDPGYKTVTITGTATVDTDPLRFRQIIRNLYVNALHHGGDTIRITLQQTPRHVQLSIVDNGPGHGDEPADVFTPFGTTTVSPSGHTGLALSLAHRLAIILGGHLTYQNDPEVTFTLQLPTHR